MLLCEAGDNKSPCNWLGLRLAGTWHAILKDVGKVPVAGYWIREGRAKIHRTPLFLGYIGAVHRLHYSPWYGGHSQVSNLDCRRALKRS